MSAGTSSQTPLGSLQRSLSLPSWLKRVASYRMGWNGKEELEGGVERKDRGGKGGAGVKNEEGGRSP